MVARPGACVSAVSAPGELRSVQEHQLGAILTAEGGGSVEAIAAGRADLSTRGGRLLGELGGGYQLVPVVRTQAHSWVEPAPAGRAHAPGRPSDEGLVPSDGYQPVRIERAVFG